MNTSPLRIVHFVSGGGTGSTRVALDLALAQMRQADMRPHLILRDKGRPLSEVMQRQIDDARLPVHWVGNLWPRRRVIRQLAQLCRDINPDVFLAHGYSEHLWGRRAAIAERVPVIIHVEHNVESYLPWRVRAARKLAAHTHATVCVSSGVEAHVRRLGIGSRRVLTLHNGVDLTRFHCDTPLHERAPDVLMPARFARKKDQPTLIRAAKLLVERGWSGKLLFAGRGKATHRRVSENLVLELGLEGRVEFLGNVDDLPQRFAACRITALSSRQEGLPLVLAEAMAAGCAVVASAIPGVTDIVWSDATRGAANGWTFLAGDAAAAADAIGQALSDTQEAQRRADAGRRGANGHFSLEQMAARYENLIRELCVH